MRMFSGACTYARSGQGLSTSRAVPFPYFTFFPASKGYLSPRESHHLVGIVKVRSYTLCSARFVPDDTPHEWYPPGMISLGNRSLVLGDTLDHIKLHLDRRINASRSNQEPKAVI